MAQRTSPAHAIASVDALLAGLVDYAGLFPPAAEDMREALGNYADYLQSSDERALGRFIVPVSRLEEMEANASDLLPKAPDTDPWRVSALLGDDARDGVARVLAFNRRHSGKSGGGRAVIDVVELKASTPEDVARLRREIPPSLTVYFEVPVPGDVDALVAAIARAGARAKIRTGGITPQAFPRAEAVIDFVAACLRERVPFKATAGLHHPLRGEYRLTYEPNAAKGMMYGYLNVFLAAALLDMGESPGLALDALEETDGSSFIFEDDAIIWRGRRITVQEIRHSREFAISFGSCSFREPIDELAQLTRSTRHRDQ